MTPKTFKVWDKVNKEWPDKGFMISNNGVLYEVYCGELSLLDDKNYEIVFSIGLTDKSGLEIYSGHIVKFKSYSYLSKISGEEMKEYIKPIIWNNNELCWWIGSEEKGFKPNLETDDNQFEIVGNKFENPELKEKGE